jgi:hypothetical protein
MSRDLKWLPSVGDEIEVWYDDGKECWKRAVVIGYYPDPESKQVIAVNANTEGHKWKLMWSNQFRPIRSEEDKAVEEMMQIWVSTTGTDGQRMQALYRAGYRKQKAE